MIQHRIILVLLIIGLTGTEPIHVVGQKATAPASRNRDLSSAAWIGNLEKVRALLVEGADPNAADERGVTPLMETAGWTTYDGFESGKEERHAEIVNLLVSKGAKINIQDKEGATALMWASAWGHGFIAQALLNNGASVNYEDKQGRTALTWAAHRGAKDTYLVQPLLKKGAHIRLMEALLLEDMAKAHMLVDTANLQVRGPSRETPLMLAARAGDMALVKVILDRTAQVNAVEDEGFTALMMANGATPTNSIPAGIRGWDVFGIQVGRAEVMEALLVAGAKPNLRNKKGETALHWASELGNADIVRVLLKNGADPNIQNADGETPLRRAIEKDSLPVVNLLIDMQANPNAGRDYYSVPLIYAVGRRTPDPTLIALLLKNGADINLARDGRTVLMAAAHEGTAATVTMLLAKGAKVNTADNEGDTALMLASGWNSADVVKALLTGGADVFHKNHDGHTALDVAVSKGQAENAALLKRAMQNQALKK